MAGFVKKSILKWLAMEGPCFFKINHGSIAGFPVPCLFTRVVEEIEQTNMAG